MLALSSDVARADHSWTNPNTGNPYHWARTSNPFTLKLGDNVSSAWDSYLVTSSADWSASTVLDTSIVTGQGRKNCSAVTGTAQVCNKKYGFNGWLGVAEIWVSGDHIVKGRTRMNDTYFNTSTYNSPAWRQFVMCQEVGHLFGLDHQDEDFNNPDIIPETCMDYTRVPAGNGHPNAHDYDQLEAIYAHLDSTTTVASAAASSRFGFDGDDDSEGRDFGQSIRARKDGRANVFIKELRGGTKVITHVFWAD